MDDVVVVVDDDERKDDDDDDEPDMWDGLVDGLVLVVVVLVNGLLVGN